MQMWAAAGSAEQGARLKGMSALVCDLLRCWSGNEDLQEKGLFAVSLCGELASSPTTLRELIPTPDGES